MAVYTVLTFEEIRALVGSFKLGYLTGVEAVGAGIENTTYFLTCAESSEIIREYVLTIGESITATDMEFVATLTKALASAGLPVPAPILSIDGSSLLHVKSKPALLVPKVIGSPPLEPSMQQCRAVGHALANLHQATLQLGITHTSHRSLEWVAERGQALLKHLPNKSRQLLRTSIQRLEEFVSANKSLPQAIIHGDLFRDNTLFQGDRLAAIIDFFSAGNGYLLFDLAVAANDWCLTGNKLLADERLDALLSAYHAVRPLISAEKNSWNEMLAIAALRFWVSRLADRIFPSPSRPSQYSKDPFAYETLLIFHQNVRGEWPESLK